MNSLLHGKKHVQPWCSIHFCFRIFPGPWTCPEVYSIALHFIFPICKIRRVVLASSWHISTTTATSLKSVCFKWDNLGRRAFGSLGPDKHKAPSLCSQCLMIPKHVGHTAGLWTQLATLEGVDHRNLFQPQLLGHEGGLRAWMKASSRIPLYMATSKWTICS